MANCRKCSVNLVIEDNWLACMAKQQNYTCRSRHKLKMRKYNKKYMSTTNGKIKATTTKNKFWNSIPAGIYGIFNDCKLIYIGESTRPYARKIQHFSKRSDLDQAIKTSKVCYNLSIGELQRDKLRFKMFEYIDDTEARKARELELIQRYKPLYNEVYV